MQSSPLRERTSYLNEEPRTPSHCTPTGKGSKFMKTPSKIPSVKKSNLMGFTPKSSLNEKKYRYGQNVKSEVSHSTTPHQFRKDSQEKENELFEFTSKPFLTSFERQLTNNAATPVYKQEKAVKQDTTRCDSEIQRHMDSMQPFHQKSVTPTTMSIAESTHLFHQQQFSGSEFSQCDKSSSAETNMSHNYFDIPQQMLELTDEMEDKQVLRELQKKFPSRKKGQESFGSEFRSCSDFFSEEGLEMKHRFPEEGQIKSLNFSKIQQNLSLLATGFSRQKMQQNDPSPQKQLTARFPSVEINSSRLKHGTPEMKMREEEEAQLREITEENESKYGSKARKKLSNGSLCDFLDDVSQSKLLDEPLMNCSLVYSDNYDKCAESLSRVRSNEQSIPLISENPKVTIDLHKIDKNEPSLNKIVETSKTDRLPLSLEKMTPKAVRSELLNPILRSKQRSPQSSKTSSTINSAQRTKRSRVDMKTEIPSKSPNRKPSKFNLQIDNSHILLSKQKRKSQTPKSRNPNPYFSKLNLQTSSLAMTSKHSTSQNKKFTFSKQELSKLNRSTLLPQTQDGKKKQRPHQIIRNNLRQSVSPLRKSSARSSSREVERTPPRNTQLIPGHPHVNKRSKEKKFVSQATLKRMERKQSPEKKKEDELNFEFQKRVENEEKSPPTTDLPAQIIAENTQIPAANIVSQQNLEMSFAIQPQIADLRQERAASMIQKMFKQYKERKRVKLLLKKKLLIDSILQARSQNAKEKKIEEDAVHATTQKSERCSDRKKSLNFKVSPVLSHRKSNQNSPKMNQLFSYRGDQHKVTEFSLDLRNKEVKGTKKRPKVKKELHKFQNLPKKFEPVRKKEEKKQQPRNVKKQLASRLLIHSTLMRSCMASFYSTQLTMWKGIMQHYENKY